MFLYVNFCPTWSLFFAIHEPLCHNPPFVPPPTFPSCSERVFTAQKIPLPLSHRLALPLFPLSVCPLLFHVHAHLSCCCSVRFGERQVETRNPDEETESKRNGQSEKGTERAREGGRKRECDRKWERERGSEILLIHRDRLRYRGNVVSIVTALLRMPLVGNKKRTPLTAGMSHTKTQQSPTYI